MGIFYGMVARGQLVLAEFSAAPTNASAIARQVLGTTQLGIEDSSTSYSHDPYVFHVRKTDSLTVLCMADDAFGHIHLRFVKTYGHAILSAPAYAMNDEFSRILSQQMDYYSNNANADKLNLLKGEMSQVRGLMMDSIERVLERGDRLALLVEKTTTLQGSAVRFKRHSRRFKNTLWWRNVKLTFSLYMYMAAVVEMLLAHAQEVGVIFIFIWDKYTFYPPNRFALVFILLIVIYVVLAFGCHVPSLLASCMR